MSEHGRKYEAAEHRVILGVSGSGMSYAACHNSFLFWLDEQARRLAAKEGEINERR